MASILGSISCLSSVMSSLIFAASMSAPPRKLLANTLLTPFAQEKHHISVFNAPPLRVGLREGACSTTVQSLLRTCRLRKAGRLLSDVTHKPPPLLRASGPANAG